MGMFSILPPAEKVFTATEAQEQLRYYEGKEYIAFDTETTGLSRPKDRAIILAISDGVKRCAIWPSAIPYFGRLLEDPSVKLIAHNANFDCWMLKNIGINVYKNTHRTNYRLYDTMVMHALLSDITGHDLKSNTRTFLDIEMVPFSKVFDLRGRKKFSLEDILMDPDNTKIVANYASLDAYATFKLFQKFKTYLEDMSVDCYPGISNLMNYYMQSELKFTKVLFELESNGIGLNVQSLQSMAPTLKEEMLEIQKWFGKKTGRLLVNPGSTKQMGEIFFQSLGRKPFSYTDGGAPQLNKTTLDRWASSGCEYAIKLLRYRELDKQHGTYIVNLLGHAHMNKIHASFNQTGARTGRLSSSDPNLQNQPPFIREAYIPRPNHKLLASDYAQLEMRILAHMSRDPTLCSSIKSGLDVHSSTAATMFKVSYDDIIRARQKSDGSLPLTDLEKKLTGHRKAAKAINFGLMYGQGAAKLAATLGCENREAWNLIRQYFAAFPKITQYFDSAIKSANERGYCTTLMGRRRLVPGLKSMFKEDVADAERKVKNSPIQGTAADIAKMAMIKLYEDRFLTESGTKMLIQVHDEIVFEVPEEYVEDKEFNDRISNLMMHPFDFDLAVPLETSGKYGDTWLECK